MKVNIADIRRQYAELSDEGLLELNRDDLVDQARQCYDAELAHRGLTAEEPFRAQDLVIAATYGTASEAQLARALVRGAGIPAYLSNENVTGINPLMTNALGGLDLLVPAGALDSAREVLASRVSDSELADDALATLPHVRHGVGTVRPYVYGTPDLLEFVETVFHSVEIERQGEHVEVMIGDSVLVCELGDPPAASASTLIVYVEDVDATYGLAIEAGAASLAKPTDQPHEERTACVIDPSGNTWWISTYLAS